LLLVPRHPQRFAAVAELLTAREVRFERRSERRDVKADTEVLLVDTVGELAALYAAVDVAFVGGSLVPVGGHNLLEPAALGVPVATGPYQSNAREIAELLVREGAVIEVADAAALGSVVSQWLGDPDERRRVGARGRRVVEENRGSLARVLGLIAELLEAAPSAGS
jgi:3-deoxy-D-manno-octulosonic-acid transferase